MRVFLTPRSNFKKKLSCRKKAQDKRPRWASGTCLTVCQEKQRNFIVLSETGKATEKDMMESNPSPPPSGFRCQAKIFHVSSNFLRLIMDDYGKKWNTTPLLRITQPLEIYI